MLHKYSVRGPSVPLSRRSWCWPRQTLVLFSKFQSGKLNLRSELKSLHERLLLVKEELLLGAMDQASASQTSESRDSLPGGAGAGTEQLHSKSVFDKSRGRGRGGPPNKKRDMGRSEWRYEQSILFYLSTHHYFRLTAKSKTKPDKRRRNDDQQAAKRQRIDRGDAPLPVYATQFSKDDIAAQERRPKKKVAVLIGYSGTGYRGMQL